MNKALRKVILRKDRSSRVHISFQPWLMCRPSHGYHSAQTTPRKVLSSAWRLQLVILYSMWSGTSSAASSEAPGSWSPTAPLFHGLRFNPTPLPWLEAKHACELWGGSLVRIDSFTQNMDVDELVATDAWIGASDREVEGQWVWTDGNLLQQGYTSSLHSHAYGFTNWDTGEPNNDYVEVQHAQDCAEMRSNGRWDDNNCSESLPSVCEFDVPSEAKDGGSTLTEMEQNFFALARLDKFEAHSALIISGVLIAMAGVSVTLFLSCRWKQQAETANRIRESLMDEPAASGPAGGAARRETDRTRLAPDNSSALPTVQEDVEMETLSDGAESLLSRANEDDEADATVDADDVFRRMRVCGYSSNTRPHGAASVASYHSV